MASAPKPEPIAEPETALAVLGHAWEMPMTMKVYTREQWIASGTPPVVVEETRPPSEFADEDEPTLRPEPIKQTKLSPQEIWNAKMQDAHAAHSSSKRELFSA